MGIALLRVVRRLNFAVYWKIVELLERWRDGERKLIVEQIDMRIRYGE